MARSEKGMTQHDVYETTGISTSQLSSYENDKQMIGLVTLAKIAVALDTSIDRSNSLEVWCSQCVFDVR